jgi:glycosyltransferase involved in cell wall biosynthesis
LGRALAKSMTVLVVVTAALRLRKTSLVWTVHNVRGHEQWHGRLATRMWRWFVQRVDGYIALTPAGRAAALERFPDLRDRPGFVIPHGDYRGEYPDVVTRTTARAALGLPPNARVVAFFGTIRPYKNLPVLLDAFRLIPDVHWRLIVAGQPATPELGARLVQAAADDPRIRLDLAFVPRDQVQFYLRAADLVVVPYREILNSGSALLALSFDRPVLVPERGAMAELRETAGPEWVRTYPGELTPATLVGAMAWATATPRDAGRLLRHLDWDVIARQTVAAYEAVTAARRAESPRRLGAAR